MNWYYAAAGKQAGPVTDEEFNHLVSSGVITSETLVWHEGLPNWEPYRQIHSAAQPPTPEAPPAATPVTAWPTAQIPFGAAAPAAPQNVFQTEEQILAREYKIDIGGALERAWATFTTNAGLIIGTVIVFAIVIVICGVLSSVVSVFIPMASVVLSLLYSTPLNAGLRWFFLRLINKEEASLGDIFAGFSRNYVHLVLFGLAQLVYTALCLLPCLVVAFLSGLLATLKQGTEPTDIAFNMILSLGLAGLLGVCALVYLGTLLTFTMLLIVDKGYSFWPAMRLSARMTSRRWWMTFLFVVVAGVIGSLGVLACFVGLLVTGPLAASMLAAFYDDNFRDLQPRE